MIPTIPRFRLRDPSVPRAYLIARNAFTAATIAMAVLLWIMITFGIVSGGKWGAADGTGVIIPAWLVIALGCVPPVATSVLFAHLTANRAQEVLPFLTAAIAVFVALPIALGALYPDPTGLHWDPNDEYWDPEDPRANMGWHWLAAPPQVVTITLILAGALRFRKELDAERAAAIAAWNRRHGR